MRKSLTMVALAAVLGLAGCTSSVIFGTSAKPDATAPPLATGPIPAHCHARDHRQLPDRRCTPGATNPAVTPATIGQTICKPGWTTTVRPPVSYTNDLKTAQIRAYGYSDTNAHDYEEDHQIPLELGGAPRAKRNLWPEFDNGHVPNPKDSVENALRRAVCDGRVMLRPAQAAIARNWLTAENRLGL